MLNIQVTPGRSKIVFFDRKTDNKKAIIIIKDIDENSVWVTYDPLLNLSPPSTLTLPIVFGYKCGIFDDVDIVFYKKRGRYGYLTIKSDKYRVQHIKESISDRSIQSQSGN